MAVSNVVGLLAINPSAAGFWMTKEVNRAGAY